MKLVQLTEGLYDRFGDREAIRLLAEAGFDGYDYSMFHMTNVKDGIGSDAYLDYARALRAYADSLGFPCLQAHAPFRGLRNGEEVKAFLPYLKRAIEIAGVLGCPILIIHPANNYTAEQNYEEIYRPLLPLAKECNVKIATENMWNYDSQNKVAYPAACGSCEDFCRHVDMAKNPYLGACLDIGHAEMPFAPGAPAMIRSLGADRLIALHVHDNDKVEDLHIFPLSTEGRIVWRPIIDALREIGYRGNFTFEASNNVYRRYPNELIPALLRFAAEVGRYFIREITK